MTWPRYADIGPYHLSAVDAEPFRHVLKACLQPRDHRRGMYPIARVTGVSPVTLYAILRGQEHIERKTADRLRNVLPTLLPSEVRPNRPTS